MLRLAGNVALVIGLVVTPFLPAAAEVSSRVTSTWLDCEYWLHSQRLPWVNLPATFLCSISDELDPVINPSDDGPTSETGTTDASGVPAETLVDSLGEVVAPAGTVASGELRTATTPSLDEVPD